MLTIGIGVAAVVVISAAAADGKWGVVAFAVIFTLVLIIMSFQERQEGKADTNRTEYWANGGPAQNGKRPGKR